MARHRTVSQRSRIEWCVRAGIALATAGLGYAAVTNTLAYTIRGSNPARAYALSPGDGRIGGLLSEQMSGPEAQPADRLRADALARDALRQDPTAVAAVATLGINAQIRGETAVARRLFSYAATLSRRDLRTQLWAIEDAVARNDIREALLHYDTALRTSRVAPDLLFPVLASAIVDPIIRSGIVARLKAQPTWSGPFIVYLADIGADAPAAALLFRDIARAGIALPDAPRAALLQRLIEQGKFNDAWSLYAAVTPGVDRRRSRDPNFTADLVQPSIFDWVPVETGGISATLQREGKDGVFDFIVPIGMSGPILRQVQMLPPGDYVIEGRSTGINQPAASLPYWVLSCGEVSEIGRVPVPDSRHADGRFSGRLRVSEQCPVQYLTLITRPSEQSGGVVGQLRSIQLRPIAR